MREGVRNVMVGAAGLFAVASLTGMLLAFGELDWLFASRYPLTVHINSAAGLTTGNQVLLDGVRVGVVKGAYAAKGDPSHPVQIVALIDRDNEIPADAVPRIEAAILSGGATLWLVTPPLPDGATRRYLATDGSAQLTGEYRSLVQQIGVELDARMQPLIEALQPFRELGDTYLTLGKNLNEMVRPQTSEALSGGESPNIRTAVIKLNTVLDDAGAAIQLARQWLGDEQLGHDARSAVSKAVTLIDSATEAMQAMARAAGAVQTDGGELVHRLLPVTDQISVTLEEVRRLTQLAASGQGTIAQLLNNPDLYNSLNDAAVRLERTLVEAQLLIQKIKSEGLPIDW